MRRRLGYAAVAFAVIACVARFIVIRHADRRDLIAKYEWEFKQAAREREIQQGRIEELEAAVHDQTRARRAKRRMS